MTFVTITKLNVVRHYGTFEEQVAAVKANDEQQPAKWTGNGYEIYTLPLVKGVTA